MGKRPVRLAQTLGTLLRSRGLEGRLSEYRIHGQWEKSVGPGIAAHAQPVAFRGKKLTLSVDSPAWLQQLSLLKPELIEKLNKNLGGKVVSDITLRIGEVVREGKPPREQEPARAELGPEDREKIEQYLKTIYDPEVRTAVRRVMEKDFGRKKAEKKREK